MGDARHDGLAIPGRVILAHEPPFRIADVNVHPATRQVERGRKQATLEPRVMQVLVALARANGGIVTRDELIESCWDGRVVGDDSINRVLSRIRRLAADLGGGAFTVETIARVGYRLMPANAEAVPATIEPENAPSGLKVDRRRLIGGAVVLTSLAGAGAAGLWFGFEQTERPPREARALFDQAVIVRQEDNRQALAYLREAVRIAPDFGEAWGLLAITYRTALNEEAPERVAGFEERLMEAVRNAERYDPGNADAAAALLPSTSPFGRWSEFEPVYRNFIGRYPRHAAGYLLLATLLMEVGRWSDAVGVLRRAKARNESSPILRYKLIVSLWGSGQITAAEHEIDEAMQLWPQHGAIWQTKIKVLALTGRPREALALARDPAAMPLSEEDVANQNERLLFLSALSTGAEADAERATNAILKHAREVEADRVTNALLSAVLGRIDLALDMLEGVYLGSGEWALRSSGIKWLSTHPLFQPHAGRLWPELRFQRILAEIGLERYWRMTGTVPDYRRSA